METLGYQTLIDPVRARKVARHLTIAAMLAAIVPMCGITGATVFTLSTKEPWQYSAFLASLDLVPTLFLIGVMSEVRKLRLGINTRSILLHLLFIMFTVPVAVISMFAGFFIIVSTKTDELLGLALHIGGGGLILLYSGGIIIVCGRALRLYARLDESQSLVT